MQQQHPQQLPLTMCPQEAAPCSPSSPNSTTAPVPDPASAAPPQEYPAAVRPHHIHNPTGRHLNFSSRRNDLLNDAHELSVLCDDAQVATIIFSPTGVLSEFCSSPSMSEIIDRYKDAHSLSNELLHEREFWKHEALNMREELGNEYNMQSYMMDEKVTDLSISELQRMESKFGNALNKIRARKMEVLEMQTQKK